MTTDRVDARAMAAIEGRDLIDGRGRNYGRPASRDQAAAGPTRADALVKEA